MNGNLGRDRIWNDHIWSEIDTAVREEVGRIRVAQKVFPSTVVNNLLPVSATRAVPFGGAPAVPPTPACDLYQPFFEISRQFVLTQAQVEGDENVRLASSFARLAASAIANAEDTILFLGPGSIPPLIAPRGVEVTNQPPAAIPPQFAVIPPGFVAEANNFPRVRVRPAPPAPRGAPPAGANPLGDIMTAIADGMVALNADAQSGPYALFVSPFRYAQTFAPVAAGLLQTPADQINHVVTGGFYMVNSLFGPPPALAPPGVLPPGVPSDIGILVSLGGEPAKIILGKDGMTAFTFADESGNYHFRVFESIQMVVRDGRAFRILEF